MAGQEDPVVQWASHSRTYILPSEVIALLLQAESQQRILKTIEKQKENSGSKYYSYHLFRRNNWETRRTKGIMESQECGFPALSSQGRGGSQDSGLGTQRASRDLFGKGPRGGLPQALHVPSSEPPPPQLPALCKDQGTEMRRGQSSPRLWGGLTDIMFATLKEKVFNGMKMSLITGAKLRSVQVQGDRDALVPQLHFHLT